MRCPNCGAARGSEEKFCSNCGGVLAGACPNCGAATTPGEKFCAACGKALAGAAATVTADKTEVQSQASYAKDLTPYYRDKFQRFDANGGRYVATWNWPAFFLTWLWYLSKGMVAKGLVLLGTVLVLMVSIPGATLLITLLMWLYGGLAGNYDYYLLKRKNTQWWG